MRGFRQSLVRRIEEIRIRTLAASSHSTTQLVQLGQAEHIGAIHDQRIRIGNIQAGFHNGGTHQNVELVVPEVDDHVL
ncbi:Uncharacterised protein [Chlamydia trachomatis]|nr:Uncharacterised protein [Chlamydia trachomatis]